MPEEGYIPESSEGASLGLWMGTGGANGYLPEATATSFDSEAFIARRGDHLGLTLESRLELLEWRLPQGTDMYFGLFSDMPSRAGIGGTEIPLDRIAISRWVSSTIGARGKRVTADSIVYPSPGVTEAVVLVGWGLWDASTGGNLKCFDFTRTDSLTRPITWSLEVGARPAFTAGDIGLIL